MPPEPAHRGESGQSRQSARAGAPSRRRGWRKSRSGSRKSGCARRGGQLGCGHGAQLQAPAGAAQRKGQVRKQALLEAFQGPLRGRRPLLVIVFQRTCGRDTLAVLQLVLRG